MNEYVIYAPFVAKHCLAGQFVILRVDADGERVPFTICDYSRADGTVSVMVQEVGYTTAKLAMMQEGDALCDFVGPLGNATDLSAYENICLIGGGIGSAVIYPQAKQLKAQNKAADVILGARNADLLMYVDEFEKTQTIFISSPTTALAVKKDLSPICSNSLSRTEKLRLCVCSRSASYDESGLQSHENARHTHRRQYELYDGGRHGYVRMLSFERRRRNEVRLHRRSGVRRTSCRFRRGDCKKQNLFERRKRSSLQFEEGHMIEPRRHMPTQPANERIRNFDEVALGYTAKLAKDEADRCLNCKNAPCMSGCPVGVHIPDFIANVKQGNIQGAYRVLKNDNNLAAICGRVCPQENQCEKHCVRKDKLGGSVAIGNLERYVADQAIANGYDERPQIVKIGKRVAVVGSGPASLSCAADLARCGVDVTMYEALHEAGGVLVYGIPEFRLPKALVKKEIDKVRALGVDIETNVVVGKTIFIEELLFEYDAVFIGTGAGVPMLLKVKGENLNGVYSANEYLTRINLMKAYQRMRLRP